MMHTPFNLVKAACPAMKSGHSWVLRMYGVGALSSIARRRSAFLARDKDVVYEMSSTLRAARSSRMSSCENWAALVNDQLTRTKLLCNSLNDDERCEREAGIGKRSRSALQLLNVHSFLSHCGSFH